MTLQQGDTHEALLVHVQQSVLSTGDVWHLKTAHSKQWHKQQSIAVAQAGFCNVPGQYKHFKGACMSLDKDVSNNIHPNGLHSQQQTEDSKGAAEATTSKQQQCLLVVCARTYIHVVG